MALRQAYFNYQEGAGDISIVGVTAPCFFQCDLLSEISSIPYHAGDQIFCLEDLSYYVAESTSVIKQIPKFNSSGLMPLADLGTGTPSSSNFLRGDGSWQPVSGSSSDPAIQDYSPGSFTVATEKYAVISRHLKLTGSQRVTLQGTATLRIT